MTDRTAGRASLLVSVLALAAVLLLFLHRSSGTSTPSAPAKTAPASAEAAAGNTRFWQVMEQTHREAGNDSGEQSGLIEDRLKELSPKAIIAFDRERHRLDKQLYTWKIWGAATVIEDGCSDDCFRDFRAYLISLGPTAVEQAMRNPDGLAPMVQDAENGDWENADNVAPDAYSSVTGNDYPLDDSDLSGPPEGPQINLQEATLRTLYPRLAARFRQ
ncbi:MAG TPA: DUF4240 domain-containing protein [Thermoleophilaceae bacterium]|nr:DUF4240 domain-containing protein [Thermoleophilaceae bacterium]